MKPSQFKILFGNEMLKNSNLKEHNKITTTKYNLITWLPKSLLLQFTRLANIYFLIISTLTCLSFSPKNPITMIGTFSIVLVFTILKEGFEVYKIIT
jgi:phospholipid-transporting ATPase